MNKIVEFFKNTWKKIVLAFVVAVFALTAAVRSCSDDVEDIVKGSPVVQEVLQQDANSAVDGGFDHTTNDFAEADQR